MHHLWGKFIEMTIDLSVKFDPPKNGSHLNDPWRTQHQNPAISGVSPLSCVPCLAAKLISFFLPARITFRPSETNQLFPALRAYLLSREKVERPRETQKRNRSGFVPGGGNPKQKWHSFCFPNHYASGSPGSLLVFNLRRRFQKEKKPATRHGRGIKTEALWINHSSCSVPNL